MDLPYEPLVKPKIKRAQEALFSVQFLLREIEIAQQIETDYDSGKYLPPLDIRLPQSRRKINPQEQSKKDYYIFMHGQKPHFLRPGILYITMAYSLRSGPEVRIFRIDKELYDNKARLEVTEDEGLLTFTEKPPQAATLAVIQDNQRKIGSAVSLTEEYVLMARRKAGYSLTRFDFKLRKNNKSLDLIDYAAQATLARKLEGELKKILASEKNSDYDNAGR